MFAGCWVCCIITPSSHTHCPDPCTSAGAPRAAYPVPRGPGAKETQGVVEQLQQEKAKLAEERDGLQAELEATRQKMEVRPPPI